MAPIEKGSARKLTAQILDGKKTASRVMEGIKAKVQKCREEGRRPPGLAVVILGENPASRVYVEQKEKLCRLVGFNSILHRLPEDTTEKELLHLVRKLNADPSVDGILVQLPLPGHIDGSAIIGSISPEKDVDGFHPLNVGKLITGLEGLKPCTPRGVMTLLDEYDISLEGKNAVIIGGSGIVGKPVAQMLLARNATITVCHIMTRDLASFTRDADIIIVAVGKPRLLTADMVRDGAVIVDVGINQVEGGIVGDTDFDALREKVSYITPVPGGIGPMTTAMLLLNTMEIYEAGM